MIGSVGLSFSNHLCTVKGGSFSCLKTTSSYQFPLNHRTNTLVHPCPLLSPPVDWCCALRLIWSVHSTTGSVKCQIIKLLRRSRRKVIIKKGLSAVWRLRRPSFYRNTTGSFRLPKPTIQRSLTRFMRLPVIGGTQVGRRIIIDISSTPQTGTSRSRTITCNM